MKKMLVCVLSIACFSLPVLAANPLTLEAAQLQSLGIQTQKVGDLTALRGTVLPAKVLVPNAQMRVVSAPFAGLVSRLLVAPGARVKKGEVLAHLNSPDALALQREFLQASSQASLANANKNRDQQLFDEGLIAKTRLETTQATANEASALLRERQQTLAFSGAGNLKEGVLRLSSPIDGVVLSQSVQTGERVDRAAMIYTVAQLSPLWLEIQAPIDLATKLREGMLLHISEEAINAKLIAVGSLVDPISRSVLLRAEVKKGAEKLLPGQLVSVTIGNEAGNDEKAGENLPAAALVRDQGKVIVFVLQSSTPAQTVFMPREVKILSQNGDVVRVEGIKAEEKVVLKGVSSLKAMMAGIGGE